MDFRVRKNDSHEINCLDKKQNKPPKTPGGLCFPPPPPKTGPRACSSVDALTWGGVGGRWITRAPNPLSSLPDFCAREGMGGEERRRPLPSPGSPRRSCSLASQSPLLGREWGGGGGGGGGWGVDPCLQAKRVSPANRNLAGWQVAAGWSPPLARVAPTRTGAGKTPGALLRRLFPETPFAPPAILISSSRLPLPIALTARRLAPQVPPLRSALLLVGPRPRPVAGSQAQGWARWGIGKALPSGAPPRARRRRAAGPRQAARPRGALRGAAAAPGASERGSCPWCCCWCRHRWCRRRRCSWGKRVGSCPWCCCCRCWAEGASEDSEASPAAAPGRAPCSCAALGVAAAEAQQQQRPVTGLAAAAAAAATALPRPR